MRRLADALIAAFDHARRWGLLALLLGFAPGWTLWALLHPEPGALVRDTLEIAQRLAAVRWGLASLFLLLGAYLLAARRRRSSLPALAPELNRRRLLLAGLPLLALLTEPGIAAQRGLVVLFLCLGFGLLAAVTAAAWRPALARLEPSPRTAAALLALTGTAVAGLLIHLGITRHHALASNLYDLGIFEHIVWRSLHGDLLACSLFPGDTFNSEHFAPILLALVPAYALVPRAETLIVLQVLWLCAGVVPLYLWSRRRAGSRALALAIALAYLLSPLVHALALWDFHELGLAVPLLLCALWAHDGDRPRALALSLGALLLVREEMGLLVACFGAFSLLDGRPRRGIALLLLGLAWFALVARVFAPGAGIGAHAESLRTSLAGATSYRDLLLALLANPVRLPLELLRPEKAGYLLCLATPLLLLPALGGRLLLLALPGAAILVLTANQYVHDPYFHYTSFFLPAVFAAAAPAAVRVQRWCARPVALELAVGIVATTLVFAWSFGFPGGSFRAGFRPVPWSLTDAERERHAHLESLAAELPPDACVGVTGDVGAHLAARRCIASFPRNLDVDFLVLHRPDINPKHFPLLHKLRTERRFLTVDEQHRILVLRRNDAAPASDPGDPPAPAPDP